MSRFAEPQDPAFREMNTSLGFDRRLWPHDIAQSRAHAKMLAAQGIIGDDDRDAILAARSRSSPTTRTSTWPSSGG
jgi:argininosuccinate lyase